MRQVFGLQSSAPVVGMSPNELARASVIYGLGFFILMGLFALMYIHAHRRRAALGMTDVDAFDARALAGHHLVSAGVGLFAMLFALIAPRKVAFLSPSSFALMGPGHWAFAAWIDRRRKAFIARLAAADVVSDVQAV
ncbi:MAG: hypothetical protein H0W18_03085 [Acidobacteria bacterium]|nr:hypothetical protein [Acidobacteriota bacterium]